MEPDLLWLNLRELPYFRATLRAVEGRLVREIELPRPVLDIGCGDGHFASVTYDRNLTVGIDPDARPLKEAHSRSTYDQLLQAKGNSMPFGERSFSSAISNSVLEHIPRLDEVLSEIGRVLKPGAPFVFTVPNPGYRSKLSLPEKLRKVRLGGAAKRYEDWFMKMSRTYNLLDVEEWKERLARAGLELVRFAHYFSPSALRMLEWGHYFGAPCLVSRWLTGRWILSPTRWNLAITDRWVRRFYDEGPVAEGTYTFYLARRTS